MRYYLLVLFTIFSLNLSSQISGFYSVDINNAFYCGLSFDKNLRYNLVLVKNPSPGSDIIDKVILSFGTYSGENNFIYLKDINGIISIKLQKEKDHLVVRDGFKFINNKSFILFDTIPSITEMDIIFEEKSSFCAKSKLNEDFKNFKVPLGKYVAPGGYVIILKEKNVYEYLYGPFVLSSGSWENKNGIIICHDSFFIKDPIIKIIDKYSLKDEDGLIFRHKGKACQPLPKL